MDGRKQWKGKTASTPTLADGVNATKTGTVQRSLNTTVYMYFITGFFLSPNIDKPVCGISMKFVHLSQFPVFKTQSEDTARTGPNIVSNDTCYCVNWPLKRLHREEQQRQPTTTGLQVKDMSLVLMKPTLAVGVFILWRYLKKKMYRNLFVNVFYCAVTQCERG